MPHPSGWKLFVSEDHDRERYVYNHTAVRGDERILVDVHPSRIMAVDTFDAWLRAGRPPRYGLGPLTEREILWLAEHPDHHLTAPREPVPWLKSGRLLPLDIPEDWKPT